MQCLEVAFRRTRPQRHPGPHRPGDAFDFLGTKVLQLEQIAEKPSRAVGNDDGVRLGQGMQARRKVRRLADDATLLCLPRSDQVADDHQPGRDADTALQGNVMLERTDSTNQLQPRPHRLRGVVLMGLRIAEIDQHAIAHVFGDEAAEATHGLCNALLIG